MKNYRKIALSFLAAACLTYTFPASSSAQGLAFGSPNVAVTGSGVNNSSSNSRLQAEVEADKAAQGMVNKTLQDENEVLKNSVSSLETSIINLAQTIALQQQQINALTTFDPSTIETVKSSVMTAHNYAYCPAKTTLIAGGCNSISGAVLYTRPSFPNPTYKGEKYNGWNCGFQGSGVAYALCRRLPE